MITAQMHTWKTTLSLTVRAEPDSRTRRALANLLHAEVERLDRLASRFRDDSELSQVNAHPGEWVEVSWDFVAVLAASLRAAEQTRGLVDPTLGRAIKAAGYDAWAGQETPTTPADHRGKWRGVGIRPGRGQAQVLIPRGTALDLGSVAKAWLADRLALALHRSGFEVCANMGGDLRVIATTPWTVWADPDVPGIAARPIDLVDGALATSGVGKRTWTGGHHIIDPRTGRSARTSWTSVSVVAATAADANAAATAGVILAGDGPAWMRRHGLDAVFAAPGNVTRTGRWPAEEAA
ncbi:MAG: FAD:protein FMN transferase [Candidatus Nanopelagicales bacterium]|jgi:thiamine biosynthesis lipoprotein|nr:FAD:protein FMN transferase [Candidatus Nanopelagicales bacterium]